MLAGRTSAINGERFFYRPEIAQKAIDDQTKEQKMLTEWIAKHGG